MNRTIYQTETQARFDGWRAELARMKAEADKMQADARREFYAILDKLQQNWQDTVDHFEELRASTDDVWTETRTGFDEALTRLGVAFEDARQSFVGSGIQWVTEPESEGWPEGQGRILGESEGWTEGQGETIDNSQGWVQGLGKKVEDSAGWPEGQKNKVQ